MQPFVQDESIEMIGVGASKHVANEWFEGLARIREIVEGNWKNWGDVKLDVAGAKITVQDMDCFRSSLTHNCNPYPKNKTPRLIWVGGFINRKSLLAMTYSPRQLPTKYHRR